MSVEPRARVETNANRPPSGDNAAWSSNAGWSVSRSRPSPSVRTRKMSAEPKRSDVNTTHSPPWENDAL